MRKGRMMPQPRTLWRARQSASGARWSCWTSTCPPLLCRMASTAALSQVGIGLDNRGATLLLLLLLPCLLQL